MSNDKMIECVNDYDRKGNIVKNSMFNVQCLPVN